VAKTLTFAQIKAALASQESRLRDYADPVVKKIGDWTSWRPMADVGRDLNMVAVPDYVQRGYGNFMSGQAKRANEGDLRMRDLIKAHGITLSSVGRQGLPYNTATKQGMPLQRTDELVRPEGAFADWLGTPHGQRYLNAAERGEVSPAAMEDLRTKFAPFGKQNDLVKELSIAATRLPQKNPDVSQLVAGPLSDWRGFAKEDLRGIDSAKTGFVGSLLGRGDLPTLDARQLQLHTPGDVSRKYARRIGGGEEAVDRLAARQNALGLDIDPSLEPYYQHLTHHAVWDKAGNAETTHADLIRAMMEHKEGGSIQHLAGGGKIGAISDMAKRIAGEEVRRVMGLTDDMVTKWKADNMTGAFQKRVPEAQEAVIALGNRQISPADYRDIVARVHPVRPYTESPKIITPEELASVLDVTKVGTGLVGFNKKIPQGSRVATRQDVPSKDQWGQDVVSLHDSANNSSIGYGPTAYLKGGLDFVAPVKGSHKIASGMSKTSIARIHGDWQEHDPEELKRYLNELMKNPEWAQVGMNPFRHSYFYDKADMLPVTGGEELAQLGGLVMIKKPIKMSPDDPQFRLDKNDPTSPTFKDGGEVQHLAGGGAAWQRAEGKSKSGGLNAVGRASYHAQTGGTLKPPVKGGDNPRRASFLARMGNMPGPMAKDGKPTRLALSLRAWGAASKEDARAKARAISKRNK